MRWHGFQLKRRERDQEEKPQDLDPEVIGAFATLLLKIIGSTVKDRLWRGVLAALVTGVTVYVNPSFEPEFSTEPVSPESSLPVQQERSELPQVRPRNDCDADHLDWPGTAAAR